MNNLLEEYKNCFGRFNYTNDATDTEYGIFVNKERKEIILRFQGSESEQDWVQNFTFSKILGRHFFRGRFIKPFKTFFLVHKGIYTKYASVEQHTHSIIDPLLKDNYKLKIYGFSQGGGITCIAHEDFWYYLEDNKLNINQVESYAFAPPMVFGILSSKLFKERFSKLTVVRNVNDIVPKVPSWIFGYRHYGTIIKIGKWKLTFPWQWLKEHMSYKKLL